MNREIGAKKFSISSIAVYLSLILGAVISLFPFYWLLVMTTNTQADIMRFPPKLVFGGHMLANFQNVFAKLPFMNAFYNSLTVSTITTALTLFFCSLAGFVFAKFEFPGRKPLFFILIVSMMLPYQLGIIPGFIIIQKLGWVNSFNAIIIPSMVTGFGIFWMRQFASANVHDDLIAAGKIDGCNRFQLYLKVALPIMRPAMGTLGLFTFLTAWNDYLWPLIVINSEKKFTLQLLIASLRGAYFFDYTLSIAATFLATIPLILIFLLFNRQFIAGIAEGAVKS